MVDDFIFNWLNFISSLNQKTFLNYFWYFIFIEFTRYVLFDFIVILINKIKKQDLGKEIGRKKLYQEKPLISILAPGKNEGENIYKLVMSLKQQTYQNYELIIVDDGSTDNTKIICNSLLKNNLIDEFISYSMRGGKASAANSALMLAKGKYIIHLDADSYLEKDAIENIIISFYIDEKIGAISGDVEVYNYSDTIITYLQAIEYFKTITLGRLVSSKLNILRIVSGAYGAFKTDILKKIKGWDVGPGLDGDITLQIRKMGYKIIFEDKSICYTNVPVTLRSLIKQRYRWNRSLIRFRLRKHRNLLNISYKSFNIFNFLTILDGLVYNFLFNILWWYYLVSLIFITIPQNLPYVFFTNYILYIISNYIEYFIILWHQNHLHNKKKLILLLYIPLMPLYTGLLLRVVRTYAQIMELFFKASFYDNWNPYKVSKIVKEIY